MKYVNNLLAKTLEKLKDSLRLFHGGLLHPGMWSDVHAPYKSWGNPASQDTSWNKDPLNLNKKEMWWPGDQT